MVYCKKFLILFFILLILFFNFSICFAADDIPEGYNLINQSLLLSNTTIAYDGNISSRDYSNVYYIDISNFDSVLYFNTLGLHYILTDNIDFSVGDNIGSVVHVVNTNTNGIYLDTSAIDEKYLVLSYFIDNKVDVYGKDYSVMHEGVQNLVDNVGFSALWDIFGNTTSYILIVVTVALGLFLLFCVIRGISKTKTKF